MNATLQQPRPPAPPKATLNELERVLIELRDIHERMVLIAKAHRAAISRADLPAISAIVNQHNDLAQVVAQIERRRATIVAALLGTKNAGDVRMSQVIAASPQASRERLSAITASLRDVLTRLHAEQQAIRAAAQTLATHMEGVMRQVYRAVSHAGTYVRSGRVDTGVQVLSAIDVRS